MEIMQIAHSGHEWLVVICLTGTLAIPVPELGHDIGNIVGWRPIAIDIVLSAQSVPEDCLLGHTRIALVAAEAGLI